MKELEVRIAVGMEAVSREIPYFRQHFGCVGSQWKKDASRVTEADHHISNSVLAMLRSRFPEDDLCSEESETGGTRDLDAEFAWVLDPIDGTNNYALGIPHCAISLALLQNGMPVYGWIYDYPGDRVVHGGAGKGIFSGEERLDLSGSEKGNSVPVGLQFPVHPGILDRLQPLLASRKLRSLGSSTLEGMYVALGLMEGAVDFRVKVWDIAAFIALFPEVGITPRFLDQPAFPLRSFSPEIPPSPYLAGSADFMRQVDRLLREGELNSGHHPDH